MTDPKKVAHRLMGFEHSQNCRYCVHWGRMDMSPVSRFCTAINDFKGGDGGDNCSLFSPCIQRGKSGQ